jgi:ABC-2 type transport system ATP-binding protein
VTGQPPALEARNVSRWYGNVVAVNGVSFAAGPGITALLGPNGAGKSTLLHMLAGLLAPSSGEVRVLGEIPRGNPGIYRRVGLVPERDTTYGFLTGRQYVRASAALFGLQEPDAAARRAIAAVGMEGAEDRPIATYSKGMRQRIKVAAAIVHEPEVLVLDEPFNGTDPAQRLALMDLFRRMATEGRTILISSHILEEVERLAEQIVVLYAGRLAAVGDFREIRRLMRDRPHTFTVRASDPRRLAACLVGDAAVRAIEFADDCVILRTTDFGSLTRFLPRAAKEHGIRIYELRPTDESLESVFAYLVGR